MSDDDMKYFTRRAQEERELEARASDPCARAAHAEIAARYERLVAEKAKPELKAVAQ